LSSPSIQAQQVYYRCNLKPFFVGEEMSEWIKCINQMPAQGQKVLIFTKLVEAGEYWEHEPGVHDGDTGFIDVNDDEVFPVTHWMPLPGAPEDSQ
jgi:hypothetical protein